jgi:hypothetical protein
MSVRLAALALGAALGACSSGPAFVPHPEAGIELRWPRGEGSVEAARAMADMRCRPDGKRAVLIDESADRDEILARFVCA